MKKYANLFNIWSLSVLFQESNQDLILDFLNCFKVNNKTFVKSSGILHFVQSNLFDFHGTEFKNRFIYAYDEDNNEHIFELYLVKMTKNMPYNEIRINSENFNNKKKSYLKDAKNCSSINVIAFFNYDIEDNNDYLIQKRYIISKPFNELRLNFIFLNNFVDINSYLGNWVNLFKNAHKISKIPIDYKNTIFEKALNSLEVKNWSHFYRREYKEEIEMNKYDKESDGILSILLYKEYFSNTSVFYKNYKKTRLNFKLLEKKLGFYPKTHIDIEDIILIPIQDKIDKIALTLFKKWRENASKKYGNYNFEIIDEKVIIKNFEEDFKKAILNMLTNDSFLRGTYSYKSYVEHIWGYIQGALNTIWVHEYIAKRTDDYKKFSAIKAIKDYLKLDKVKKYQLNKLYRAYLVLDSNIKETEYTIEEMDLREGELELEKTGKHGDIEVILENIVAEFVIKITQTDFGDFLDTKIMYEKLIKQTLKENEKLLE